MPSNAVKSDNDTGVKDKATDSTAVLGRWLCRRAVGLNGVDVQHCVMIRSADLAAAHQRTCS
jgi:hypothetical protein